MKKKVVISAFLVSIIGVGYCFGENFSAGDQNMSGPVREAIKIVSAGLQNEDPRIRTNAIEVVSDGKVDILMDEVTKLCKDPSMPVRFAAAVAIGDRRYRPAKKEVMSLLSDDDENVVMAAAYAAVKLGEVGYSKIIAGKTTSQDQTIRANSAMLLGKLGDKGALKLLYRIKDDKNSSDAAAFSATEAISRLGDEKIYSKIWTMLISTYADDRYMGTIAMSQLGGTKAIGALISMLDDEIMEVQISAADRLGMLGDRSGAGIIANYLKIGGQENDKIVRERRDVMAAIAIGHIGEPVLINYLPKMLNDKSIRVRLAAAKSIFVIENNSMSNRP